MRNLLPLQIILCLEVLYADNFTFNPFRVVLRVSWFSIHVQPLSGLGRDGDFSVFRIMILIFLLHVASQGSLSYAIFRIEQIEILF